MYQKNFQESNRPGIPANNAPAAQNSDKLEQQRNDRVYKGRSKHPLGRLIPAGIDIDRKKQNIQEKTRHRNSRDLRLVMPDKLQELLKRISRIKLDEIIDDKA